jgi:hypothetical protein
MMHQLSTNQSKKEVHSLKKIKRANPEMIKSEKFLKFIEDVTIKFENKVRPVK